VDYNIQEMMKSGERGWNMKRLINIKLGLSKADDKLPKPLLEPLPDGGAAGYVIEFDEMMSAYYDARGWDPETGYPTSGKLKELNLEWAFSSSIGINALP
ncbi:MAG: aldehyde ferredoxin oxidoreductase C-terminal domain-containing protein, partial [Chloroflexota bacterium]